MPEAYFEFGTNARQVAAEIEAAMRDVTTSLHGAAMGAGARLPVDIGEQIHRSVADGVERSRRELATLFNDVNIAGARGAGGFSTRENLGQIAANAFNQVRLQIDQMLGRMDPAGRLQLQQTGGLDRLLSDARQQVITNLERDFVDIRNSLSPESRRGIPRAPDVGRLQGELHQITDRIAEAELERLSRIFVFHQDELGKILTDAQGRPLLGRLDPIEGTTKRLPRGAEPEIVSQAGYVAAEQQALKAEAAERAARTKERIQADAEGYRENTRHAKEGADQLGQQIRAFYGEQDAIWRALGVFSHPETGVPVRRTAAGAEEVIHPVDMARLEAEYAAAVRDLENVRRREMGDITRIGRSQFYQGEQGQFFKPSAIGTGDYRTQGLRQIDPARERLDYLNALDEVERQQLRVEQGISRGEDALLREGQAHVAAAERDDELARRQQARMQQRGVVGGFMTGLMGSGFGEMGDLNVSREQLATNLSRTAGSALRYAAAYGGLYELANAATQAVQEFSDFQDSLTDYEVAVSDADAATFSTTSTMMELTRVVGENVGAAYDSAARGVRAFADAQASAAEKAEVGISVATAAQQMAVITGKSLTDVTGDVVSIGTSFGLSGVEAETVLPDAIANAKKLGGDPAEIAQGLSNFAVTAEEAGWSIQEAANIISLVQSRTDQSGQAVATRLSRMVSILGGTTGKSLIETINRSMGTDISTAAEPAKQIEQIARAYVRAGQEGRDSLQGLIRSQLGGTSNVRELIPLLEEQGRLQQALSQSLPGAGATEYERKISKFISEIDRLRGSIKNLVVIAAEADLATPFAALVYTIEPTLHMLERLLTVYTKIKDFVFTGLLGEAGSPISAVATGVGELALGYAGFRKVMGSRFAGEVAGGTGFTAAAARSAGVVPAADSAAAAAAAAVGANTVVTDANTAAKLREAAAANAAATATTRWSLSNIFGQSAGALTGFGGFMASVAKFAAVGGAIVAFDKAIQVTQELAALPAKRARLVGSLGSTSEELDYTAQAARAQARAGVVGVSTWENVFGSWFRPLGDMPQKEAQAEASRSRALAEVVSGISDAVAAEERLIDARRRSGVFGDMASRTTESLADAMEELIERGVPPQGLFRRFREAWMEPPLPAIVSGDRPVGVGAEITDAIFNSIREELPKGARWKNPLKAGWQELNPLAENGPARASDLWSQVLQVDPGMIRKVNEAAVGAMERAAEDGRITQGEIDAELRRAMRALDMSDLEAYGINLAEFRKDVVNRASNSITLITDQGNTAMPPPSRAELDQMIAAMDANLQAAFPNTLFGPLRRARENLLAIRQRFNAIDPDSMIDTDEQVTGPRGAGLGVMLPHGRNIFQQWQEQKRANVAYKRTRRELRLREHAYRELLVSQATMLREAEEATLDPDRRRNWAALTRIRGRGARREFAAAGDDVALLKQIMDGLDRQTIQTVMQYYRTQLQIQKEALERVKALIANTIGVLSTGVTAPGLQEGLRGEVTEGEGVPTDAMEQRRQRILRRVRRTEGIIAAQERAFKFTMSDLSAPWGPDGGGEDETDAGSDRLTAAQLSALRAGATIAPDDNVALAKNAIDKARADMAAAKGRGQEYWAAVEALTQAQYELGQALAGRAAARALAAIDPDDAVGAAKAQLDGAVAMLNRTTPGTEARANAVADVKAKRDAMEDAVVSEANAFQAAEAARVGGDIASAQLAIDGARRGMAVTAKDTEEYANLLAQYFQGQQQLRDAMNAHQYVLDQLAGDMTDPVEQARDALRDVRRRLNAAIRAGQAPDVIDALRLEEEQAQHTRERSAFDQRMSDAQTANELGRMSFQAYMNYLDREHDRLKSVKNRTRQQQDMLNEVDLAIKQAMDSMDSQFNLGDIDVNGLVYQTRRFMAEAGRAHRERFAEQLRGNFMAQQRDGNPRRERSVMQQDVRINIDGADVASVRRVLNDILGPRAGQTRAVMNRKVG